MNRRDFLKTAAQGIVTAGIAATAGGSLLTACSAPKTTKGGSNHLKLSFEPYELKLRHPFGVAVNTRTHTPGVQVQLEYEGIIGYGEASMPPYLGETEESVCKFLASLKLDQFRYCPARSDRQAARTTVVQNLGIFTRKGSQYLVHHRYRYGRSGTPKGRRDYAI